MASTTAHSVVRGIRVHGLDPTKVVTVVERVPLEESGCEVTYRDDFGDVKQSIVEDLKSLTVEPLLSAPPTFSAPADDFRLAAEATRIKHAALYDPMVAVNSSQIDPLPHQIRAVYEHLLPKVGLRYLLADDPGAGKTIMAGLYIKEMMLRSNCERAIVVAPGGLVDQWQDELREKFDLHFEVLDRHMVEAAQGRNVFQIHPYLLVRMDMVARNDELMADLEGVNWDIAVVDEAHRMSARFSSWQGRVKETRRFQLGRVLADRSHNFLLMTATPHAGKEDDFQLFMSLLDRDRFEGKYRPGVHRANTDGLMRRMVKEDLLTFEGAPLFPERHAYTVSYQLSAEERELYEQVTRYVRTEMGRADRIAQEGDKKRGNAIGFALTMLQRRLASSPHAIYRSLVRRKNRLSDQLKEFRFAADHEQPRPHMKLEVQLPPHFLTNLFEDLADLTSEQQTKLDYSVDEVVSLATAAQTIPELEAEIASLEFLIATANQVRRQDEDEKWVQLRQILDERVLSTTTSGHPRKIIIFTEHRDTLDYLHRKVGDMLGDPDAVVVIHGGVTHPERKAIREQFTHDPKTQVLIGTDAAGEGLNLQRAHLMVNYDLPWNPNRIEQRFGRIHRIGQREVCHLWNLVAADTREGDVFTRLLTKIDQMSKAYNGKLFNVLGERDMFDGRSLRELMIEAIKYGDRPEVQQRQFELIDSGVSLGLDRLALEGALAPEVSATVELEAVRRAMEDARERRLQPGFIAAFFIPAFKRLGGRIVPREQGRFQIKRVPKRVIDRASLDTPATPFAHAYERITFDPKRVEDRGGRAAELIAPGNPLLEAVINLTLEDLGWTLEAGTVFVDRSDKQSATPRLSFIIEQQISSETTNQVVSHSFDYVSVDEDGNAYSSATSPYLAYDSPSLSEDEEIKQMLSNPWFSEDHSQQILPITYTDSFLPQWEEAKNRVEYTSEQTRNLVHKRLIAEINHWDTQSARLRMEEIQGKTGKITSKEAQRRSKTLRRRLAQRLAELEESKRLIANPPTLKGTAVIIPSHMLEDKAPKEAKVKETEPVNRRAVDAVLAAERALGRAPEEKEHANPGYDIESTDEAGNRYFIEVKGRIETDAKDFEISKIQVSFAHTHEDRHRLALVRVSTQDPELDQLRYIGNAFDHMNPADTTISLKELWRPYWDRGSEPY